jgi:hypothetical protein
LFNLMSLEKLQRLAADWVTQQVPDATTILRRRSYDDHLKRLQSCSI